MLCYVMLCYVLRYFFNEGSYPALRQTWYGFPQVQPTIVKYLAPFNRQPSDVWILLYCLNKRFFSFDFCLNVGGRF